MIKKRGILFLAALLGLGCFQQASCKHKRLRNGEEISASDTMFLINLFAAANARAWVYVIRTLERPGSRVTIDTTPYPGLTLLHIACRQKDQEIINYLVAQGAYVAPELEQFIETYAAGECQALGSFYTDRTSFNEFVYGAELDSLQRLFVAAQLYGCRDAASCLRQILLTNDLHCACSEGNLARVKQLFEKGVLVDGRDRQKKTALHQACLAGYLDIVKYLFGRGAQLNPIDIDGNTPVYWACFEGNFAIVQYLVEKGVRVDKDKRLLEVSLQSIKPDSEKSLLAKFLINHGARIAPEIAVEYQEILGQIPQNQVAQKI